MSGYKVAVLGATGAVGRQMIKVLEERSFPVSRLIPLASARSAGQTLAFQGEQVVIQEATPDSFTGADIVLGAVSNAHAQAFAPDIARAGAVFIDNSSAFRLREDVPLVVPEINAGDIAAHHGIIANPNCSTIISMVALAPLVRLSPVEALVACTYQAVSGAGQGGITELDDQLHAYVEGRPAQPSVFPAPIASNVIPMIGSVLENGYTTEEMKMQNEGRKILHLPQLQVCCTCVRVPVMRSHSIALTALTRDPVAVEDAVAAIASAPGCRYISDLDPLSGRAYPTPLDTTDQDLVFVGRARRDLIHGDRGISLWCCGDQIRKGAATNAVQIAQELIK